MKMSTLAATCFAASMTLLLSSAPARAEYPDKPIEVVVPFAAGGGTDALVRTLQQALGEKLPQPVAVINVPGAAGVLGSRKVMSAKPDGYTLLVSHATVLTAAAQKTAPYGPEAFEPIAHTASSAVVVAVAAKSPYQTLGDLMKAAQAKPNEVKVVTNIGAVAHYAWLMLADAAGGAQFRYIQGGGGAKRLAQIVGGQADASVFATNEAKPYQTSGDLRVLAVMSKERHPDFPDVPTAMEAGLDASFQYDFWWFAPKGTPKAVTDLLADKLQEVMADGGMRATLAERSLTPTFARGEALARQIDEDYARIKRLAEQYKLVKQ